MLAAGLGIVAAIAWSATAAVAAADLLGEDQRTIQVARAGALLGALFTAATSVALVVEHGIDGIVGPPYRFVFLATVVGLGVVVAGKRFAMRGASALAAPLGAVLMASYLLSPQHMAAAADNQMDPILVVHIGLVLVGMGTFALAAIAAALYLVQERQLRKRSFGPLFHRLPSVEELDTASFRLVLWGFVVYTAALALGFTWSAQSPGSASGPGTALAVIAWAVFAAVIHTRITTGWRGRQSALMTIAGCATTYLVLAWYVFR